MQGKYLLGLIFFVLMLLGLWFELKSPLMGYDSATNYMISRGGMDPAQFNLMLQGYIDAYRLFGAILAGFGGLGILVVFKQKGFEL